MANHVSYIKCHTTTTGDELRRSTIWQEKIWCGWRLSFGQSIATILPGMWYAGSAMAVVYLRGRGRSAVTGAVKRQIWNCNTASWIRTNWNGCWIVFAQNIVLKRLECDALSHFCKTRNSWKLARRVLILRLGCLDCKIVTFDQYKPTIFQIASFPQAIFCYELIRTVFGATLHNRHATQHTPRTSFRPDLMDNEESAKQKAEGCLYAKIAKRTRHFKSTIFVARPSFGNQL